MRTALAIAVVWSMLAACGNDASSDAASRICKALHEAQRHSSAAAEGLMSSSLSEAAEEAAKNPDNGSVVDAYRALRADLDSVRVPMLDAVSNADIERLAQACESR